MIYLEGKILIFTPYIKGSYEDYDIDTDVIQRLTPEGNFYGFGILIYKHGILRKSFNYKRVNT